MFQNQSINNRKKRIILLLTLSVFIMGILCLFAGSSHMTVEECADALFRRGNEGNIRIIWKVRIPRVLAAIIAGAGLSVSGLIMQTTLGNSMASPSTLGVSNAAVFGANLSIIAFAGGFLSTGGNVSNMMAGMNPYAASLMAFVFSILSTMLILALCKKRRFSPNVVVLAGIAVGSVWTAATSVLQFFATDVGLSAAVIWSFGDLGRATYRTDLIMLVVVLSGIIYFLMMCWQYNALLSGESVAGTMGINVSSLRFASLFFASLITAVCVSFLGVIGFVGIICPHTVKKLLGQNHRFSIPASSLAGSFLLLFSDTLARSLGNGSALPVGALTSLLGAPFFLAIVFSREGEHR